MEVKLIDSLTKGKKYYLSLKYSIAKYSNLYQFDQLTIDALLTDSLQTRIYKSQSNIPQNISANAQLRSPFSFPVDTSIWQEVKIEVIGNNEQYLTIGNFQKTDTISSFTYIYVYIDDVKLWAAPEDTVEPILHPYLKVYPNPTLEDKKITFEHVHSDLNGYHLIIHNYLGQRVFEAVFDQPGSKITLHLPHLASGVYSFRLRNEKNINYGGKFVVLE